ncbi:hypothetical protein GmHk_09G025305 [Glycine max]|nr:hypothetical protein GmHk_09G025305 [Glycine max]
MSEIEEMQEQMKVDMEAMKEQMAIMMEAMTSMEKMMEVNAAIVDAVSTSTKVDPAHPSGLNQVQNKHSFPPYGLPPNYTPPNVAHTPNENVNNFAPIPIESQQPQSDHAHDCINLEAQVVPPMMEKEMITMIVDTLPVFYYEKMVSYTPLSFAELVFTDERIEVSLRRGKFDYPALMNRKLEANEENEKEGGTNAMTVVPT